MNDKHSAHMASMLDLVQRQGLLGAHAGKYSRVQIFQWIQAYLRQSPKEICRLDKQDFRMAKPRYSGIRQFQRGVERDLRPGVTGKLTG
jgi:hypothetical protein